MKNLKKVSSEDLLEELKSRGYLIGDTPMTTDDLKELAYSNNVDLEEEEVEAIAKAINSSHTPEEGINWWVLDTSIRAYKGYRLFTTLHSN